MALFHHSTFVIAFAVRMGERKLFYLLTYLLDHVNTSVDCDDWYLSEIAVYDYLL